eukprot:7405285-Pyramimonas_sp.AAC.2
MPSCRAFYPSQAAGRKQRAAASKTDTLGLQTGMNKLGSNSKNFESAYFLLSGLQPCSDCCNTPR